MKEELVYFKQKTDFSYYKLVESNTSVILKELNTLLNDDTNQRNHYWFAAHPNYVTSQSQIAWKTFEFIFFGIKKQKNIVKCPETFKVLSQIPELITAQFSILEPKTHIKPHKGYSKIILRNHLPLIVPKGDCAIQVEKEIHQWKKGELMIFDDSYLHSAWNNTDEIRAVLMFDVAKPDCGYNANQICRYKIENIDDPFLLDIADKSQWMNWYEQGYFDSDF